MANMQLEKDLKGRLYIVRPTLDALLISCPNTKEAANLSGMEYSNFIKTCKIEKDLRISTYKKCATGLGYDTLIVHLPCGLIDSIATPKFHTNQMYQTIGQDEMKSIFRLFFLGEKSEQVQFLDEIVTKLLSQENKCMFTLFISELEKLCKRILNDERRM